MVIGFDKFRDKFGAFANDYVIIGGSACDWLFTHRDARFRATKDIDLVVCAEQTTDAFVAAMWDFIREGGYSAYERKDGRKCFYRFLNPTTDGYPFMLEFFSRETMNFPLAANSIITPIPTDDESVSSLSGILLDENYYSFIRKFRQNVDGVCVLSVEALLLLKARAWMDLSARKARGEFVKDKDLAKHRKDVFRLQSLIGLDSQTVLSKPLFNDFKDFLQAIRQEPLDPQTLGAAESFDEAMEKLESIFIEALA